MSGIVGLAHSDGKSTDPELLRRMTRSLSFRGPDGHQTWINGSVGLGHAGHLISGDSTRGSGIDMLGHRYWITANIRLDARDELIQTLQAHGQPAHASCSDSQLLLLTYDLWGESCFSHLAGDFAFILWDEQLQELFCACDHLGIRQLYFAHLRESFICSNILDCLRLYPGVSACLNEVAIADFLLFGMNQCESTTSFLDIQRLPRGHYIKWSRAGLRIKEYWRPPVDGYLRYKNRRDYVEHFEFLLERAVADRTRGHCAGILLSGGLDSSSLAGFANEEASKQGAFELHAFTASIEDEDDDDSRAAQEVADYLGIPIHYAVAREIPSAEQLSSTSFPEPVDDLLAPEMVRQFEQIAGYVPVVLSGEGADNLMDFEMWPHLRSLWRQKRYVQAGFDISEHALARFRAPDGVRGPLRRLAKQASVGNADSFPDWLNPEFVKRLDLRARWSDPTPHVPWTAHPQHPRGYGSLFLPQWPYMFQREDPAFTKTFVEVRYPFLDLRIVSYLLSIPSMPWSFRKYILRRAVRQRIPKNIRNRPKISSYEDPLTEMIFRLPGGLTKEHLDEAVRQYVSVNKLDQLTGKINSASHDSELAAARARVWCLSFWLEQKAPKCEELARFAHA